MDGWKIIILASLLFIAGWQVHEREMGFREELRVERFKNERLLEDLVKMERDIKIYRMELGKKSFKLNMGREEFLDTLAEYLAKDGRCEVVIEKVDWSTWADYYGG